MRRDETDLKLPHHKHHKGSVHAALDDKNSVGEFGTLSEFQIIVCRKSKEETFKYVQNVLVDVSALMKYLPLVKDLPLPDRKMRHD